uniref:Uncharacterized protein n=1 Tax=Arundo donax TaxID=35708 RepID=A0A0A9AE92_ARUDO
MASDGVNLPLPPPALSRQVGVHPPPAPRKGGEPPARRLPCITAAGEGSRPTGICSVAWCSTARGR